MVRTLGIFSLLLWLCAQAVILVAVGWRAWPVVAGWAAGGIVVVALALVAHRQGWARPVRVAAVAVLVAGCVVLTWEGGLFFVPAALVLFVAALAPIGRAGLRASVTSVH